MQKRTLLKVIIICIMTGVLIAPGFSAAVDKAAEIDTFFSACFDRELLNGTVLVAIKGNVIYEKAFGLANSDWDIPNGIDTRYYLYTMTQQFSAALVLKLVEEGKLKLEGTVSDYLPYYREDTGKQVTIHHLLTHTHGIRDLEYTGLPMVNVFPVKDFVRKFLCEDLEFKPGESFKFSTFTGYTLLGAIIEQVTGKTYEQVLNEKILKPLEMENSGFLHHDRALKKRATPYHDTTGQVRTDFFKFPCNGATSMYSTIADLLLWDRALSGTTLFSEKTKEIMFTAHVPSSRNGSTGYGWNIVNISSDNVNKKVTWQTGAGCTAIWRILDDDILVVLLNNKLSAKLLEICIAVSNIIYNRRPELPKRSFISSLNRILATEGTEAAIRTYNLLKQNKSDEYNFAESELNILGNYLISINKIAEAVEIFRLNLDSYPNSWYIYTRLGEALVRGNNKEAAIKCFEAAVNLMPRGEEKAYRDIMTVLTELKKQEKPEEKK